MRLPIQSKLLLGACLAAATTARAAFPECPGAAPASVTTWRSEALASLAAPSADAPATGGGSSNSPNFSPGSEGFSRVNQLKAAAAINRCFPTQVPACLARTLTYTSRSDAGFFTLDPGSAQTPAKQPPVELFGPDAAKGQYVVPTNIEQLAQAKGWPMIRYKSRHSGGFDPHTPSLLMIYVPGDKVSPPVPYDRWLNFALPLDPEKDALNPTPQMSIPKVEDFAAEKTDETLELPRTFTMVSLEKATDSAPGKVYFQMFHREGQGNPVYTPNPSVDPLSCVTCHPNGLRLISPLGYHVRAGETQMPEAAWRTVKTINDAMDEGAGGQVVSWREASNGSGTKPLLTPSAYWPVYGPLKPLNPVSRTQAFITGGTLPDGTKTPGCYWQRPTVDVTDIFGRPPGRTNVYSLTNAPPPAPAAAAGPGSLPLGLADASPVAAPGPAAASGTGAAAAPAAASGPQTVPAQTAPAQTAPAQTADAPPPPPPLPTKPGNVNWQKVANAMKCEMCHNNDSRGALTVELTDRGMIDYKILVDQAMPMGLHKNPLELGGATQAPTDSLTGDERIALANCLQAEADLEQKQLTKWLTQVVCQ